MDYVCWITIFDAVSFHCNSLITVNDTEIFVCINDTPLLNVTFLYVSKYTVDNILHEFLSPETKVPGDERSLSSPRTKVPRDESSIIRQVECDGCVSNKLYSIKSILGYINLSHLNRRDAVIFRRFRIDHSQILIFAHLYLLNREDQSR